MNIVSKEYLSRKESKIMWLIGVPTVLGGIFIGLLLISFHWSLFFVASILLDFVYQYIYSFFYMYIKKQREGPMYVFYVYVVLIQLIIIGGSIFVLMQFR